MHHGLKSEIPVGNGELQNPVLTPHCNNYLNKMIEQVIPMIDLSYGAY